MIKLLIINMLKYNQKRVMQVSVKGFFDRIDKFTVDPNDNVSTLVKMFHDMNGNGSYCIYA